MFAASPQITRRRALKTGAAALGGIAVGTAGAACTTQAPPPPGEPVEPESITLPSYQQFTSVPPDFPASVEGGIEGFLSYPQDMASPLPAPGGGQEFDALIALGGKPQVPFAENTFWQQLNQNLDCTLNVQSVPPGEFAAKASTVVAGGDLPDIMQLPALAMDLPGLLESTFEDLTPHLAADAVSEFPYLANFPELAWRSCVYNGKIFGIPSVSRLLARFMVIRSDLAEQHDWNDQPADADEFVELMHAMAAVADTSYAGTATQLFSLCLPMFGVPNGWREEPDGSFIRDIETEEYKDALACAAQLWSDGVCHPNSFIGAQQIVDWFGSGAIATYAGAGLGYRGMVDKYHSINPEMRLGFIPIPRAEGGSPAPAYITKGRGTMSVIKKADPERVKQLLGIANYMAAPFGTAEYLFLNYGTEGEHFNWIDELPARTTDGDTQYMGNLVYIARPPNVLFFPNNPDVTEGDWANEKTVIQEQVPPGDLGLYSATQTRKGSGLLRNVTNVQSEVIQGHVTMNDWDDAVEIWRSEGGDAIRAELAAAREAA